MSRVRKNKQTFFYYGKSNFFCFIAEFVVCLASVWYVMSYFSGINLNRMKNDTKIQTLLLSFFIHSLPISSLLVLHVFMPNLAFICVLHMHKKFFLSLLCIRQCNAAARRKFDARKKNFILLLSCTIKQFFM